MHEQEQLAWCEEQELAWRRGLKIGDEVLVTYPLEPSAQPRPETIKIAGETHVYTSEVRLSARPFSRETGFVDDARSGRTMQIRPIPPEIRDEWERRRLAAALRYRLDQQPLDVLREIATLMGGAGE